MTKYVERMLAWMLTASAAGRVTVGFCMVMAATWITPFILSFRTGELFVKQWWVGPVGLTGTIVAMIGMIFLLFGLVDFYDKWKKENL